jgi:hypothetical protein
MSESSLQQQSATMMAQESKGTQFLSDKTKETMVGFVLGGLAACGAVTFTNPWEVSPSTTCLSTTLKHI